MNAGDARRAGRNRRYLALAFSGMASLVAVAVVGLRAWPTAHHSEQRAKAGTVARAAVPMPSRTVEHELIASDWRPAKPVDPPRQPVALAEADAAEVPWYARDAAFFTLDELIAQWTREEPNAEWSSNVMGNITARLELDELDLDLIHKVDCRQTLCRIELSAESPNTLMRLSYALGTEGRPFAQRFPPSDGGRPSLVDVFIPREDIATKIFRQSGKSVP